LEADHWALIAEQLAHRSPALQRRVKELPAPPELVLEQRELGELRGQQEQEPISLAQLPQRAIRRLKLSSTVALTLVEQ
jgi:hypothetical protein